MKLLNSILALAVLASPIVAKINPKYKKGDCITPTQSSYSWYGKIARVEAVSHIQGYEAKQNYVLVILDYKSNSVIFDLNIDSTTKKVDSAQCLY